jgi:hypothetical protein
MEPRRVQSNRFSSSTKSGYPSTIFFSCALAALLPAGCAPQVWVKPGASAQDFANDKYTCLQQSQQQGSSIYVGA